MLTAHFVFLRIALCSLGVFVMFCEFFWLGLPYKKRHAEHSPIDVHESDMASNHLTVHYFSFTPHNIHS